MITLTDSAANKMLEYLSHRISKDGIRLLVKTTGCSGLGYHLEYVDNIVKEDVVFKNKGVKVVIDQKSLAYLDGTEVDYKKEGLNEGFEFNNPNAHAKCGCGESFTVKK
mgnify:CR=1 FL=1